MTRAFNTSNRRTQTHCRTQDKNDLTKHKKMRDDVTPPRTHPPLLDYAKHKQRSNKGNCAGGVIPHAGNTSPTSPPPLASRTRPLPTPFACGSPLSPTPRIHCTHPSLAPQPRTTQHHRTQQHPTMASGPANAPPDLEWKRGAVEAFGVVSRTLAPQQAEWLQSQGVDTDDEADRQARCHPRAGADRRKAGTDQSGRGHAEEDEPFCRRQFLETKGINPEIPAADQEVRIEELLEKLEKEKAAVC